MLNKLNLLIIFKNISNLRDKIIEEVWSKIALLITKTKVLILKVLIFII